MKLRFSYISGISLKPLLLLSGSFILRRVIDRAVERKTTAGHSNDDINPDADVECVAKVYEAKGGHPVESANAALLAAAPALLAACEEALVWADSDGLKDRLRAAVAKAKGE